VGSKYALIHLFLGLEIALLRLHLLAWSRRSLVGSMRVHFGQELSQWAKAIPSAQRYAFCRAVQPFPTEDSVLNELLEAWYSVCQTMGLVEWETSGSTMVWECQPCLGPHAEY